MPVAEFEDGRNVIMATKNGIVKKTSLSAYSRPRNGGIIAINLDEGDDLIDVALTDGNQNVLIATANDRKRRIGSHKHQDY